MSLLLGSSSANDNPSDKLIKQTIDRVEKLNDRLHKVMDNDKKRYFVKNNKGEDILIDHMKCGKTNGAIDMNKCGYLPSNIQLLKDIKPIENFDTNSTKFVDVNIKTDNNDKVEKKTISLSQFKSLDCNVFQDNCKRYSKMIEGDCYPCDIIEKKDKKKNNMALASMDDIEIDEDAYEKAQMSALGIDGFQNFYQRYEQPLHNFRKIKKSDVQQDEIITEHTFVIEQSDDFNELIIEENLITALYLSGISVLGLYVLFKIFDK